MLRLQVHRIYDIEKWSTQKNNSDLLNFADIEELNEKQNTILHVVLIRNRTC